MSGGDDPRHTRRLQTQSVLPLSMNLNTTASVWLGRNTRMLRMTWSKLARPGFSSTYVRQYSSGRTVKGIWRVLSYYHHVQVSDQSAEYDVLFLRQQGAKYSKWHLTPPVKPESLVKLSYGASLAASDLIGRHLLDRVTDSKGKGVTIHEPSLASYVINSARLATPVRPIPFDGASQV